MWWLQAVALAQVLECGLEPGLRLPPGGDWKPLVLQSQKAAKGFEVWRGASVEVTRRIADGALGVKVEDREVALRPLGLIGVEGVGSVEAENVPLAVRVRRGNLGFGAREVTVETNGSWFVAARCGDRLLVGERGGQGPWGMDVNGDGKVDVNSPAEYARGRGGAAVFELAGKAYRVEGVDWKRRVVRLTETEPAPQFSVGDVLEDYEYVDRLGEKRRLSQHGEEFTLLDFWASWCAPCIAAFPQLQAMAEAYQVRVLGLNGDEDPAAASRTLAQFGVLWPDVQSSVPVGLYEARLRVALYPTYVLLDASRRVVWRGESTAELLEEIRGKAKKRR